MEKQHFNEMQQNFCYALTNVTMPAEIDFSFAITNRQEPNPVLKHAIYLGGLLFNVGYLTWLRKNNCFFSTELIPGEAKRAMQLYCMVDSFNLMLVANLNAQNKFISDGIPALRVISNMVHVSNLMHQNALRALKNSYQKLPITLTVKNKVDINVLSDAKCCICYDNPADSDYINPCEQIDHLFCKKCLTHCFDVQKENASFMNKHSFLCELCRKEVPFNNDKFEVILPAKPKVTFRVWAKQMSMYYMLLYCLGIYTLGLLL